MVVLYHKFACEVATLGLAGRSPKAPGTVGSLLAMLIAYVIMPWLSPIQFWLLTIAMFFLGWWAANIHEIATQKHDDKSVVIDELAGLWLCYAFFEPSLNNLIAGFILFRFFDIVKPWPISFVDQRMKGGFGTMFDDTLAGLAAALVLYGVNLIIRFL